MTVLLVVPLALLAAEGDEPLPILLDAESSSFDQKNGTVMFRGLRITQGDVGISADEAVASGLDFEQSEWRFTGNVRVSVETASVQADSAELVFENHSLILAELRGEPAELEDLNPDRDQPIRGGANRLTYDNVERTLRMTEGAWLTEGSNEFTGCDLIYDVDQEQITSGSSDCGEPVVITIVPPTDDPESESTLQP